MFQETHLSPTHRLSITRFNLTGSAICYPALGLIFYLLDPAPTAEKLRLHLSFPALGAMAFVLVMLSYRNAYFARRSIRLYFVLLVLFSANFARYSAIQGFQPPHFAWSLVGPFCTATAMTLYRRNSMIIHYLWISFSCNIVAGIYYGTGTLIFYASNLLTFAMIVPALMNITHTIRASRQRDRRVAVAPAVTNIRTL